MSNEEMISGARACSGEIQISGAKNAALPEMAACLLTSQPVVLQNVPAITDIDIMKKQLRSYGVQVTQHGNSGLVLQATAQQAKSSPTSSDGAKTRGSFLVLGPLLARFKEAKVYYPGGCQISSNNRPVDFHIEALTQMGARIEDDGSNYVLMKAEQGLVGAPIHFPIISVGATENVLMAACLAKGETVITNAAVEPEILDLIEMLNAMGMNGKIRVDQRRNRIVVNGVGCLLNGCTHTVISDRIEAGTWAIAVAITGGNLLLKMQRKIGETEIMTPVTEKLEKAGVQLKWQRNGLEVQRLGPIRPVDIITGPFPSFPTDLLPLWVVLMTKANGPSILEDSIYDNRFKHIPELKKMGATFTKFSDRKYQVHGNATLKGARVIATDLRAAAALILAALVAGGTTVVKEFQHVLRGYENIKEKLKTNWGVQFRALPQSRPGFHGGKCTQR